MLYAYATIITVNNTRDIIEDGAILVRGTKIEAVGKSVVLIKDHPNEEVVDLEGRIIIPGLINTHMHTAQTLLRGKPHPNNHQTHVIRCPSSFPKSSKTIYPHAQAPPTTSRS